MYNLSISDYQRMRAFLGKMALKLADDGADADKLLDELIIILRSYCAYCGSELPPVSSGPCVCRRCGANQPWALN